MSEFKFQGQKFKMESSAKDFLEKYISRIQRYADSHKISDDLVDDIQQSILEKLLNEKGEITQKKLVEIVNSIGEPEDIFADDLEISTSSSTTKEKNSKYKPMLLGVCAWLAELMRIPVRVVRVLFIVLIFGYTFGIRLYLIIFVIRFVTDRVGALSSVSAGIKRVFSRLGDWIRWLGKNIWNIIKWIRRLFVCGVLLICIGMLCVGIGLFFSDLTINNQSLRLTVNPWMFVPLGLLILSFSFRFIAWIFRIKGTSIKNRFTHFIALIIAIVGCVRIGAEGIGFIGMHRYTYNFPIEFENVPTSGRLSIETMDRVDENKLRIFYELYRGNEFKAELEYSFSAKNDEIAKEIYDKANMPQVSINERGRVIGRGENNNLYNEVVPYNNPNILIKITLPVGYQLDLNRNLSRCPYGRYVYFDEERDDFFCEGEIRSEFKEYEIDNSDLKGPEYASEVALESACNFNFPIFSKAIHPEKGVELYPNWNLIGLGGTQLMQSDFSSYDGKIYDWVGAVSNGDSLKLPLDQYFEQYVCNKDFSNLIATTTTIIDSESLLARSDNLAHKLSPLVDKFANPVFVQYTYESNYAYEGEKSESLIFVLELYKSEWKVVAVVHE